MADNVPSQHTIIESVLFAWLHSDMFKISIEFLSKKLITLL